jgi:hypothetical protein
MWQAKDIGEETKIHNQLLDSLEGHVDAATESLTAEAKHAELVREKAESCGMYICIAVEVVVLILLAILSFMA